MPPFLAAYSSMNCPSSFSAVTAAAYVSSVPRIVQHTLSRYCASHSKSGAAYAGSVPRIASTLRELSTAHCTCRTA
eukprot:1201923-Rhodomonas_salina.3